MTQDYIDWCSADGTTPTQKQFAVFQNCNIGDWLIANGWEQGLDGTRYVYYHKGNMTAVVPHHIGLQVRYFKS